MPRIVQIRGGRVVGEPGLPAAGQQLRNAAAAAGRVVRAVVRGEPVVVPAEVEAARLAQCQGGCPHYRTRDQRCALCGCATGKWVIRKVRLAPERCPDQPARWGVWPTK